MKGCFEFTPRHGETSTVEEVIAMIDEIVPENRRGLINCDGPNLPIPGALDDAALAAAIGPPPRTSLRDGLASTYAAFLALHARGSLDLRDLPEDAIS